MTKEAKIKDLLDEKRHQELIEGNQKLLDSFSKLIELSEQKDDEKLLAAIAIQSDKIAEFTNAIKAIPATQVNVPEMPAPSVNVNQENVVASLREIGENLALGQDRIIELLQNNLIPKKWEFTVKREFDRIKTVTAEQQIMKPKFTA